MALEPSSKNDLEFSDFLAWVRLRHSASLNFRAVPSPAYYVEIWFDQEFGQLWKR